MTHEEYIHELRQIATIETIIDVRKKELEQLELKVKTKRHKLFDTIEQMKKGADIWV